MPNNYDDYINDYIQPAGLQSDSADSQGAVTPIPREPSLAEQFAHPEEDYPVPPAQNSAPSSSSSSGVGASQSTRALDFNTLDRITKKSGSSVDRAVGSRMAGVNADARANAEDYSTAYADKNDAAEQTGKIESAAAEQNRKNLEDKAQLEMEMAGTETDAYAKAHASVDASLGQYITARKEFQAMQVNPAQLWDNEGSGAQFGNLMSVFVTGYLSSKGIDTGVMKTLNDAIDRNISAQLENINKKGREVGMFKQTWDMMREQSLSDAEAREKMRGLLKDQFNTAAVATLASYDSDLAKAKAASLHADNEVEQAGHIEKLRNLRTDTQMAITGQELQAEASRRSASIASRSQSFQERQFDAVQKAAADKAKKDAESAANEGIIVDTTPGGENRMWRIRPDVKAEDATKLRLKESATGNILNLTNEYIQLAGENGKGYAGPGASNLRSANRQRAEQLRNTIVAALTKENSGLAVTDAERKMYQDMLKENTYTSYNGAEKVQKLGGQLMQLRRSSLMGDLEALTLPVSDSERAVIKPGTRFETDTVGSNAVPGKNSYGEAYGNAAQENVAGKPEQERTEAEKAFDTVDKVINQTVADTGIDVDDTTFKLGLEREQELIDKSPIGIPPPSVTTGDGQVTRSFAAMSTLGLAARSGDSEANDYLHKIANEASGIWGEKKGITKNSELAQWMIDRFELDGPVQSPSYADQYVDEGNGYLRSGGVVKPKVNHADLFVQGK